MDNLENPVEADKYLSVGETPFTDFGKNEYGVLDIRVFMQNVYWVNISGKPFFVSDMEDDYLNNVLVLLFENAESYYSSMARWYMIELLSIAHGNIEAPWAYLEKVRDDSAALLLSTPHEWLNNTLFVSRVVTILDSRS
jgi:hypothetical protein